MLAGLMHACSCAHAHGPASCAPSRACAQMSPPLPVSSLVNAPLCMCGACLLVWLLPGSHLNPGDDPHAKATEATRPLHRGPMHDVPRTAAAAAAAGAETAPRAAAVAAAVVPLCCSASDAQLLQQHQQQAAATVGPSPLQSTARRKLQAVYDVTTFAGTGVSGTLDDADPLLADFDFPVVSFSRAGPTVAMGQCQ